MKVLFLTTLVAQAAAFGRRPTCARDHCFREACERPGYASASADCKSFLHKTVRYCPSTSHTTTTVTVTAAAQTVTAADTLTSLATVYSTDVETSLTTISSTDTILVTSQETITAVIIDASTIDQTTTVTETLTNPNGPAKRSAAACATTICPSHVPSYATACGGAARYSSACSCHGVHPSTTTISRSTTVSTVTKYKTVTPTITATSDLVLSTTQTVVVTSDQYITETDIVSITSEVDVTQTVSETSTQVSTAVVTQTATVQNASPYFYLQTNTNQYVSYDGSNPNTFALVVDASEFIEGQIDTQGRLNYGNQYYARAAGSGSDLIDLVGGGSPLLCTISNYAAGTGSFYCTVQGSPTESVFNVCSNNLYIATGALPNCQVVTLTAYAG